MRTWTAQITSKGRPEDVLGVLTDPAACGRWAPIDFDVEGLDGDRLVTGSRARVVGRIAGQNVSFDVDVIAADASGVKLLASGPIVLDVAVRAFRGARRQRGHRQGGRRRLARLHGPPDRSGRRRHARRRRPAPRRHPDRPRGRVRLVVAVAA